MRHAKPPGSPSERACVLCLDLCRLFRVSGIAARVGSTLTLVVHAPLSVINVKTAAGRATSDVILKVVPALQQRCCFS